jgi:uncharacterized RDD family membrane protein YckC
MNQGSNRHQQPTRRVRPAGFVSRFLAFIIDLVILSITSTLIVMGAKEILTFFGLDKLAAQWANSLLAGDAAHILIQVLAILLTYIYSVLYFTFFWMLTGYTPGKYLLGLRLIRTNGRKLSFLRCLTRAVCYYLSAIFLFMGFVWIIIDRRRQAWHDKIAGTLVIYG